MGRAVGIVVCLICTIAVAVAGFFLLNNRSKSIGYTADLVFQDDTGQKLTFEEVKKLEKQHRIQTLEDKIKKLSVPASPKVPRNSTPPVPKTTTA